jgi:hypothetical protein
MSGVWWHTGMPRAGTCGVTWRFPCAMCTWNRRSRSSIKALHKLGAATCASCQRPVNLSIRLTKPLPHSGLLTLRPAQRGRGVYVHSRPVDHCLCRMVPYAHKVSTPISFQCRDSDDSGVQQRLLDGSIVCTGHPVMQPDDVRRLLALGLFAPSPKNAAADLARVQRPSTQYPSLFVSHTHGSYFASICGPVAEQAIRNEAYIRTGKSQVKGRLLNRLPI